MLTLGDAGMKNLAAIYHNPVCVWFSDILSWNRMEF